MPIYHAVGGEERRLGRPSRSVTTGAVTTFVPGNIDSTGATDVTAALISWLAGLPANSVADLSGGTFRVEAKVYVENLLGITLRNGTFVRKGPTRATPSLNFPEPLLWLRYATNCVIEHMHFEDTNTGEDVAAGGKAGYPAYVVDLELDAAIRLQNFTDCTVRWVTTNHLYGDAIQWQNGDGGITRDCYLDRTGRQGVTLIGVNLLCDNVQLPHGRRAGFDIEPELVTQAVGNIEIRNCFTRTLGLAFASGGRGEINDVWLHHNTSDGPSVPVLYVKDTTPVGSGGPKRRARWTIEDHTALATLGSPQAAVFVYYMDDLTVRRCTFPIATTQGRLLVGLNECGGVITVTDNVGSPGGDQFYNRLPAAGQTITVSGNTPTLTEIP